MFCSVPEEGNLNALSGNLEKDGYIVVGPVISEAESDCYSDLIDMLDGNSSRALLDESWCRELSEKMQQKLKFAIPQIEDHAPVQCTLFQKVKQNNWLVATHQDKSLPFDSRYDAAYRKSIRIKHGLKIFQPPEYVLRNVIAVRLSVDASNKDNGPLRLLVGTHKKGILSADAIEYEKASAVEVTPEIQRGGVLCFKPLALHASSKSITQDPRRVLHFVYRAFY